MNRTVLYVIIAVLVVGIAGLGWKYYQDEQTHGIELQMGDDGVSVETN